MQIDQFNFSFAAFVTFALREVSLWAHFFCAVEAEIANSLCKGAGTFSMPAPPQDDTFQSYQDC
jgi:hypothetical protein